MGIKDAERKRIVMEAKLESSFRIRSEIKGTFLFSRKCENNLQLIACVGLTLLLTGSGISASKSWSFSQLLLTFFPSHSVCTAFAVIDLLRHVPHLEYLFLLFPLSEIVFPQKPTCSQPNLFQYLLKYYALLYLPWLPQVTLNSAPLSSHSWLSSYSCFAPFFLITQFYII